MRNIRSPFVQAFEQLPATLPVFPLSGAVLMPGGQLPLNIFEPRYLNMIEDALRTHRLVGMVQPLDDAEPPALNAVGCAGRVSQYRESDDGRIEIVLTAVCRYRILEELPTLRGYRLVKPEWAGFVHDYQEQSVDDSRLQLLYAALRGYFSDRQLQADWSALEKLAPSQLTSNLASVLPLNTQEKQLLLEASDLDRRVALFTALLSDSSHRQSVRH